MPNNNLPVGAVRHVVGSTGEFLFDVAQRYGVDIREIKGWNNLGTSNYLSPGTTLIIYPRNNTTTSSLPGDNNMMRGDNQNQADFRNNPYNYSTNANSSDPFDQLSNANFSPSPNTATRGGYNGNNSTTSTYDRYSGNNNNLSLPGDYSTNNSRLNNNSGLNNNSYNNPSNRNNAADPGSGRQINETGLADLMRGMQSPRNFVALHSQAPVGTLMVVENPANNKSIVVEVIAPLNPAETRQGVIIQLTPAAYQRLGATSGMPFPVKLSYKSN
ncbi:MAG: LysM peptidoglycan-binding domain-containing protein [Bacteroidia bacterium]|nr:LysM peptidoglycan-binding domain-containing protein [Bacteroidia bacterium]